MTGISLTLHPISASQGLGPSRTHSRYACHPQLLLGAPFLSSSKISVGRLQPSNTLPSQAPFPLPLAPRICEAPCAQGPLGQIRSSAPSAARPPGPQCWTLTRFWSVTVPCARQTPVLPAGLNFLPAPAAGQVRPSQPTIPFVSSQGHLLIPTLWTTWGEMVGVGGERSRICTCDVCAFTGQRITHVFCFTLHEAHLDAAHAVSYVSPAGWRARPIVLNEVRAAHNEIYRQSI